MKHKRKKKKVRNPTMREHDIRAIDPNAVNQYQDPNSGLDPAGDSAMASGDIGRELGELS